MSVCTGKAEILIDVWKTLNLLSYLLFSFSAFSDIILFGLFNPLKNSALCSMVNILSLFSLLLFSLSAFSAFSNIHLSTFSAFSHIQLYIQLDKKSSAIKMFTIQPITLKPFCLFSMWKIQLFLQILDHSYSFMHFPVHSADFRNHFSL